MGIKLYKLLVVVSNREQNRVVHMHREVATVDLDKGELDCPLKVVEGVRRENQKRLDSAPAGRYRLHVSVEDTVEVLSEMQVHAYRQSTYELLDENTFQGVKFD